MKLFAYILSFYVLVLTAIPCIDVPKDNTVQHLELSTTSADQHQNETDQCSPFCTCDCCVSPIMYQVNSMQLNCFSLAQYFPSDYKSAFVSSIFIAIWQPPQLI